MKVRSMKIRIKSFDEALADAGRAMTAVAKGQGRFFKPIKGTFFASLEAARSVLTRERLELLRAIRRHKPPSVYRLAKILGRDMKNVHDDVQLLTRLKLITTAKRRRAREAMRPQVTCDEIQVAISL